MLPWQTARFDSPIEKVLVRVWRARDLLKILRDDEPLTDVFLSALILAGGPSNYKLYFFIHCYRDKGFG